MEETFNKLKRAFDEEREALVKEREKFEAERKVFENEVKLVNKLTKKSAADDIITLNAGGVKTTVKRSTLTQVKGSLLELMFNGTWEEKLDHDKEGNIFLDWHPSSFTKIIEYLRQKLLVDPSTPVPLPVIEYNEEANFKRLVTFLNLTELVPKERKDVFESVMADDALLLSENGTKVQKIGGDEHSWIKGREKIQSGVHTWKLKVEEFTHWMLIGVIRASENMIPFSYSLSSAFGWGGFSGEIYMNGLKSNTGWGQWQKGQNVELTIDCENHLLKLKVNNGASHTMNIVGEGPWQLHLNIYRDPTKIAIL